jgi:hypothetical protein
MTFLYSTDSALRKLADDIDLAKAENKFVAFLNSTDKLSAIAVHDKRLDSIIGELTVSEIVHDPQTATVLTTSTIAHIMHVYFFDEKGPRRCVQRHDFSHPSK